MDNHESHQHGTPQADPAAGHGMLIVGEKTVFLSHLPMFMSPHDFQVILEATFTKQGSDPQRVYADDRKNNPKERIYTFSPKLFVLPDLFPPAPTIPPKQKSFRGDIFRGHFERFPPKVPKEPVPIARDVEVKVTNIVHARKFVPDAKQLDQLEYFLFGKEQELFMAHLIIKPPDFDQIMSVKLSGHQLIDEDLRRGVPIKFPGRANSAQKRLKGTGKVSGVIQVAGKNVPVEIQPGVEFYFEAGELAQQM